MVPKVIAAAVTKGVVMSGLLYLLGVAFWQQVVIASVSAVLTGVFVVIAAYVARSEHRETRKEVEDVKRGLGLDKRKEDHKGKEGL